MGKKMQSVEGEEIGVRGRLAEPQHVGIAALHPEAPSEEEAPRFRGVREEGVQNRQFVRIPIRGTRCYISLNDISSIFPSLFCRWWWVSFMHLLLANRAGLQLLDRVLPVAVPGAGKLQGGLAGEEQGNAPAGFDRGVVGCLQDRRHPRLQLGPLVDAREDLERVRGTCGGMVSFCFLLRPSDVFLWAGGTSTRKATMSIPS